MLAEHAHYSVTLLSTARLVQDATSTGSMPSPAPIASPIHTAPAPPNTSSLSPAGLWLVLCTSPLI